MAHTIFQIWLDEVAGFAFDGDFDRWADRVACPLTVIGPAGQSVIDTDNMLRDKFERWQVMFQVCGSST